MFGPASQLVPFQRCTAFVLEAAIGKPPSRVTCTPPDTIVWPFDSSVSAGARRAPPIDVELVQRPVFGSQISTELFTFEIAATTSGVSVDVPPAAITRPSTR